MEQVRVALGDEAIIVSSYTKEDGRVEITAALELRAPPPRKDLPTSVISLEDELRKRLRETLKPGTTDTEKPGASDQRQPIEPAEPVPNRPPLPFSSDQLRACMRQHNTPDKLSDELVQIAEGKSAQGALDALAYALDLRFKFEPIPVLPAHPLMMIGMAGSGKTVTTAKLAVRAILEGIDAELITTDTNRTGALAQSKAYGELMDLPVTQAEDANALGLLLDKRSDLAAQIPTEKQLPCFIDTASTNPFDPLDRSLMIQLSQTAAHTGGAEPVLIASALTDPAISIESADIYAHLGVRRFVATQVDIARRIGGFLNLADATGLAFSNASITPYLARGLTRLDPMRLARLILGESLETPELAPPPQNSRALAHDHTELS
ncbi:MAG: flagellar biosynthesis protein FlhF [Parvibaculaceae bacterium]|jgi:flagellar biosynthesis protein FlhF|nr:hypothetical protein [Parvibaculaceae bacterium]